MVDVKLRAKGEMSVSASINQIIDRRVWDRLGRDLAYKNAASPADQVRREAQITREVEDQVWAEQMEESNLIEENA